MKLAFSSNAYLHFPLEETLARIAGFGYAGVEVLADVPHAWPAGLLPARRREIRAAIERSGLAISNINAFMMNAVADPRQPYWHPAWTEPYAPYRAIRREHTIRALELARDLGAPNITTEPGGPAFPGRSRDEALDLFYEELMPCIDAAARCKVPLLIEPEPDLLIERCDEYLAFIERIDSPWVGLNFDIGHAFCVGEDPQDWIARMAPYTRHYHFEDIAATRVHKHLIPGRGAIDFVATLRAIAATGYDGWITVELYPYINEPDAAAREAYEYMTSLAARLGLAWS
ncbi:MAG: sugar phosphate isomerase/epimerase [Pirellulales bacterium]|nr:sugar phosphate isomerase/epimerase [Pirellulales bacterium]